MPKGSVPKREAKKPKKSQERRIIAATPIVTSEGVEVIGKRRKRKEEDQ